ncbi:hypothetical protein CHS0354_014306 [Potamilus streckersoni]|uniref:Death domain-containing protein n=1 Tax=Potamilus streckersoni TaxID=2493646 RepID=A0AAE0SLT0_9BIVA|nr:hypothetical protein CHS0354_014306 [Potamilus streckersoni]
MAIAKERANQLFTFIETDDSEKAIAVLEEEVDFSVTRHGYNLIHLAARKGMKDIVEKLFRKGMSVNSLNENGNSALHYAAREGHLEVVELLINNGANANISNKEGNTALHTAVKFQPMNVIDRLTALGMKVNQLNGKGETPLHVAVMHNRQEAMEALLMNGANPALKDESGMKPESYAKDPQLARQIQTYSELAAAMKSEIGRYIFVEGIKIFPKKAKIPLVLSRVGLIISKLDTRVDLPFLLYCRREKTENSSIKFPLEKADEIVSDIFQIRVSDNLYNVKLDVKIPLYGKMSHKDEIIMKFQDGATKEYESTEEEGNIAYCPLQLDMNPSSSKVLVVLARPKKEECTIGVEGSSIHSKIDEDFVIDIPPGAFEEDTKITMKVFETSESQPMAEEGTKKPVSKVDKRTNSVLLTDVFQVSIEGKQPKEKVKVQIPSHEDNVMGDDIVIVAADENNLVDEKSLEIIPTKPKRHKGNIVFEVEHFSIHVAVMFSSMKTKKGRKEVFDRIAGSKDRKKPCVFFSMIQRIDNDEHLAVVECTTTENGPQRREYWSNKGYVEQDMAESGTFMMEPSQEFQVNFSGNIKVLGDGGERRLTFLPKRTSFQPYRAGLKEVGKPAVGVINVVRVQRGEDGAKTEEQVTSLPVKLQIIVAKQQNFQKRGSTASLSFNVPPFMILKPVSLEILGRALTRTQGKQLGTQLGLDPETISRIRRESSSTGDANSKIIERWIHIVTDGRKKLSNATESTLINALKAIGRQSFADELIRAREEGRILREEDFKDSDSD